MISNDWTAVVLKAFADENDRAPVFNPPRALTYSAGTFFQHQNAAFSVLFGIMETSIFADNAAFLADNFMRGGYDYPLPKSLEPLVPLSQEPGPYLQRFKTASPPLMEMLWIRLADNFTTYLLDVIGECIRSRPGLLKSSKDQMPTEAILAFTTLEELHASVIERKLISIAYLGLEKQLDWISDHLGVANMTQQGCFPSLVELVEARNCMVHNRAQVGAKYLKALAPFGSSASVGQLLRPSIDDLFVAANAAAETVASLDKSLMAKFGLEAGPLDTPNARQEGDG